MLKLQGKNILHKVWYFSREYILTLKRFDLTLQGSLILMLLLDINVNLLLRRDAGTGKLRALLEEWVYIGLGVAEFLLGTAVAWWGRNKRQYTLAGWLTVTGGFSLLVLAFPYAEPSPHFVELCGDETIGPYSEKIADSLAVPRVTILIITAILCSLTKICIWAHGLTYLDDHEPQDGPYFYGILISIRMTVGFTGMNWLRPGAVRDDWWVAHLSLSMLTLLFAVFFSLFPTKMPQWKDIDEGDSVMTDFSSTFGRVIRNKAFILQTIAMSFMSAALFSFVHYEDSYTQAKFHVELHVDDLRTSRSVSNLLRSLIVVFFVMIFRVRFSVRRSDGVKANTASKVGGVVAIFVALTFAVLGMLSCDVKDIGGMEGGMIQQPECSNDCRCNSAQYGFAPVCALDTQTTYFSPCSAGCQEYENLNEFTLFHNCTCGMQRAVRGSCMLSSCRSPYSFHQIFYPLAVAFSAAALLMQGMAVLRTMDRRSDKPLAVGTSYAIIGLISQGPGHLLYLLTSHLTCAHRGINGGACVFHRPTLWTLVVVSATLSLISAVLCILASKAASKSFTIKAQDHVNVKL